MNDFMEKQLQFAHKILKEREKGESNSQDELRARLYASRDNVRKQQLEIFKLDKRNSKIASRRRGN